MNTRSKAVERTYLRTRTGLPVKIRHIKSEDPADLEALAEIFLVRRLGGEPRTVQVLLIEPAEIQAALHRIDDELELGRQRIAFASAAILDAIETETNFPDEEDTRTIRVDAEAIVASWQREPLSDRDLRRFIARLGFDAWLHGSLDNEFKMEMVDYLVTGVRYPHFLRNVQVLAAEKYVELQFSHAQVRYPQSIRPTAKLVREVERYGAAKADVVQEAEFAATVHVHPILSEHRDSLLHERKRFETATTATELASVFRAVAPTVEAILGDVLQTRGARGFSSLGPMIAALQRESLGGLALWSQLNHVLKFSRDLEQHGARLPVSVLRIACENAFELVPQIAILAR